MEERKLWSKEVWPGKLLASNYTTILSNTLYSGFELIQDSLYTFHNELDLNVKGLYTSANVAWCIWFEWWHFLRHIYTERVRVGLRRWCNDLGLCICIASFAQYASHLTCVTKENTIYRKCLCDWKPAQQQRQPNRSKIATKWLLVGGVCDRQQMTQFSCSTLKPEKTSCESKISEIYAAYERWKKKPCQI